MKPHLIYLSIGILTLALNLFLSLHMVRRYAGARRKGMAAGEDMITFSLKGEKGKEQDAAEAALYDDTVALQ